MKFYSYFDGKTQFHKYFWALYFLLGGGGGRVDKSPRLSSVILIRKKELLLYLYYDFAVVWLFMFGISSMPFRG